MSAAIPLTTRSASLDSALTLAAQGFRVFPLAPGAKVPPKDFRWKEHATSDPSKIREFWKTWPDANVGVATGSGTVVLDVDVSNGKDGLQSLEAMEVLGLVPLDGLRVRTQSGGIHVYLKTDHPHSNAVNKFAEYPGIDIRGEGGYVVGPGSAIGGRSYTLTNRGAPQPLPPALHEIILAATPKHTERTEQPLVELDKPSNVANAIEYLEKRAPAAVEGAGGDTTTFQVAARMRDYGLSDAKAWELMLDHWNERKASPPWEPEDLLAKVQNAYRYATGAWGGEDMSAYLEEVAGLPPEPQPKADLSTESAGSAPAGEDPESEPANDNTPAGNKGGRKFFTLGFSEAAEAALIDDAEPLIDGVFSQDAVAVIYGPSNSGKTFIALDMGASVAMGVPWRGHPVSQGAVIYVAAEGGNGANKRFAALRRKRNPQADLPLRLAPCAINVFDPEADTPAVIEEARSIRKSCGVAVKLIIIDTLARTMGAGDENKGADMNSYIRNIDRIRSATGATVLIIHHTGKDLQKGARGHSSLLAAIDTEIEIDRKSGSPIGLIKNTKQRDIERFADIRFTLETVNLGVSNKGRAITSCVVHFPDETEHEPMPLSGKAEQLLNALEKIGPSASREDWSVAYYKMLDPMWDGGDPPFGCSDQHLRKYRKELKDADRVGVGEGGCFYIK